MRKCLFFLFIFAALSISIIKAEEGFLNGRILEVNRKFDFVVISLGMEDGVEKGMMFMVYRGKKLYFPIKNSLKTNNFS